MLLQLERFDEVVALLTKNYELQTDNELITKHDMYFTSYYTAIGYLRLAKVSEAMKWFQISMQHVSETFPAKEQKFQKINYNVLKILLEHIPKTEEENLQNLQYLEVEKMIEGFLNEEGAKVRFKKMLTELKVLLYKNWGKPKLQKEAEKRLESFD